MAIAQGFTQTESSPTYVAPPPTAPTPEGDRAEGNKLQNEEKKDNGRIFEIVWANVEGGFSYVNMNQLSSKNLALQNTSSAGGLFGFGAGIRLFILTLGVRARLNQLSAFSFWEVNGELGFHIPAGHWDPYLALHGGYTFSGALDSATTVNTSASTTPGNVDIHGADAGLSIGADYYFLKVLSAGFDVTGQALFLSRPPATQPAGFSDLPPAEQAMIKNQPLYGATGDSVGFGISGSLHFGVHL
jgi:hypothetical protein